MHVSAEASGNQKTVSGLLELELRTIINYLLRELGTELWSSTGAASALAAEPFLKAPFCVTPFW